LGVPTHTLRAIERRALWLAVRMVDLANRDRPNHDGLKVGGHPASSASMSTIMTALWFAHLRRDDRVAVKPHASPLFHAIQYLLGNLEEQHLHQLRAFGGLQAYPSQTKDPDPVDYSTGSVGLGAVAPLFAAVVDRFARTRFAGDDGPPPRFISLLGDAELDEGNIWEAVVEPATAGLGNVMWVVDLNRQSLDRIVPGVKAASLMDLFAGSGWHVIEAKYGARLQALFNRPGGAALREHIDLMPNERYQSLFSYAGAELRQRFLRDADLAVARVLEDVPDGELASVVQNLGGHDHDVLLETFARADAEEARPSVVFAYTVKGWGLPIAGDPLNHGALLTGEQIDALRATAGLTADDELTRFPEETDAGRACQAVADELRRPLPAAAPTAPPPVAPTSLDVRIPSPTSTQEAFGRLLAACARIEDVGDRIVTTSPDVSVSTGLGGWINKVGVFSAEEREDHFEKGSSLLRWREGPTGQHLELGISEMNFFMLMSQLGAETQRIGHTLLPVGTLYDPFVLRGLDALLYAAYCEACFVFAGTPSGVTLAPEGGAHQSTLTPSVGIELPGLVSYELAYARAVDWALCEGLRRTQTREGATYLRLSTRRIDQRPFIRVCERRGEDAVREDVLAGAYRLTEPEEGLGPDIHLVASGAVVPEVLAAAAILADEGVQATVIDVTSAGALHRGWREGIERGVRRTQRVTTDHHLARLVPQRERGAPVVTVLDGASHALSWIGSALGTRVVPLGVDAFGQSGTIGELYAAYGLDTDSVVNAVLIALDDGT
jgi:pyruvate dehydrogenase E1 component